MLAAKTALAARVDALGEDSGAAMGIENRAKLEMRLKSLEENQVCKKPHCHLFSCPWHKRHFGTALVTCYPRVT